ncbi:MAG: DUF692 domain-containing protein [Deltaproteobacteria bacterium]|nr:DUF692 domain-containing protein [Deltaproteobacteria bacterium]
MTAIDWPRLGFGVGLRAEHYREVLDDAPRPDWFEALTDNYLDTAGRPLHILEQVRRDTPLVLHGVGLSIGSADRLDARYLAALRGLADRIEPALITDHLCWVGVDGRSLFDLLPLPYTEETLRHVVTRVRQVQDGLGRRIALENPSTYVAFRHSTIGEAAFLAAVAEEADCGLLLDVNNVHVSARNLGFDAHAYIDQLPAARIAYLHLAGFSDRGSYLFDTHDAPVHDDVWALYRRVVARCGARPTLVEWDANLPSFARLCAEAARARLESAAALAAPEIRHAEHPRRRALAA